MPNPMVRIYDMETDITIDREMTTAEYDKYQEEGAVRVAEQEVIKTAADTKASAIAKLCSPTYVRLLPEEAALIVI